MCDLSLKADAGSFTPLHDLFAIYVSHYRDQNATLFQYYGGGGDDIVFTSTSVYCKY